MTDDLEFSKAKQTRDKLSQAKDYASEQIDRASKLAKLKKLAKQSEGITMGLVKSNNHVSIMGWLEIADKRYYMRSRWERNYARCLQFLRDNGEIKNWFFEIRRFDFPIKRGNNSYLPDFQVIDNDGQVAWHEVKGYFNQGSRTKLKRFQKYYPAEKLIIIDSDAYRAIAKQCKKLIGGWE